MCCTHGDEAAEKERSAYAASPQSEALENLEDAKTFEDLKAVIADLIRVTLSDQPL